MQRWLTNSRSLSLAISPVLIFLAFGVWLTMLGPYSHGHSDFSHLYAAGYLARTAPHQLYNLQALWAIEQRFTPYSHVLPFIRPAYAALVFAPLSYLSLHMAYVVWLAFNLACLVASGWLLRIMVAPWCFAVVAAAYLPVSIALLNGQDSVVLLLLLAGAMVALKHDRDALAGVLVGLGLFKFQLVLPMVLLFCLWKRWRMVWGFAVIGCSLVLLSVMVAGIYGTWQWLEVLRITSNRITFQTMAGLHPLCVALSRQWDLTLTVLTSGLVLAFTVGGGREQSTTNQLLMAITASGLLGFYFNVHDWAILLLPILSVLWCPSCAWLALPLLIAPSLLVFMWSRAWLGTLPMLFLLVGTVSAAASYSRTARRISAARSTALV